MIFWNELRSNNWYRINLNGSNVNLSRFCVYIWIRFCHNSRDVKFPIGQISPAILYDFDCTDRLSENDSSECFNRDYFRGSGRSCFDLRLSEQTKPCLQDEPTVFSGLSVYSTVLGYRCRSKIKETRERRKEQGSQRIKESVESNLKSEDRTAMDTSHFRRTKIWKNWLGCADLGPFLSFKFNWSIDKT